MSKPKDPAPAHPDGEQARRLLDLLDGGDPLLRQQHAERHREQARRRRIRRSPASDGAAAAAKRLESPSGAVPEGRKQAPRRRVPPPRVEPEPRVYVHQGPTRSAVLNAFLHAFHGGGLVEPDVTVPDEHLLAPRLVAFARRYWPTVVRARGAGDLARAIEELGGVDARDGATRFLMRRAAEVPGELGAVARDYLEHHARAGEPETDDWVAHCMAATFAGRQLRYIEQTLSPYVRDDVRRELRRLTGEATPPRARRGTAREAVLPGEARAGDEGRVAKSKRR